MTTKVYRPGLKSCCESSILYSDSMTSTLVPAIVCTVVVSAADVVVAVDDSGEFEQPARARAAMVTDAIAIPRIRMRPRLIGDRNVRHHSPETGGSPGELGTPARRIGAFDLQRCVRN